MQCLMVLFTRREDLGAEELEDYVKNTENKYLRNIMEKCKGEYCAFNNKETGQAREEQARVLLTKASKLIKCHGGYKYPPVWETVGNAFKMLRGKYFSPTNY